jgi:hypothetical protein
VLDDGGDGNKIPGAHATARREEPGRSTVARGLHAVLLPSARSERRDARATVPTLLAVANGAIVLPAG